MFSFNATVHADHLTEFLIFKLNYLDFLLLSLSATHKWKHLYFVITMRAVNNIFVNVNVYTEKLEMLRR